MNTISKEIQKIWPSEVETLNKMLPEHKEFHADHVLVSFASLAMKEKLQETRQKGRSGWWTQDCSTEYLKFLLKEHIEKGDMRDVMNIAAMIFFRESAGIEHHQDI